MTTGIEGSVWPMGERGERKVAPHWVRDVVKNNVEELMRDKGITALKLAAEARVGRKSVDRLRAGENSTLDTVGAIADVLGVEPWELLMARRRRPLLQGTERRIENTVHSSSSSALRNVGHKAKK